MFIRRERYEEMQKKIKDLKQEIKILNGSLDKWQEENKRLRAEKDDEHLENYKHHRVLLAIRKMYQKPYGTIADLINFRKDVKKEIDNALTLTNSNNLN